MPEYYISCFITGDHHTCLLIQIGIFELLWINAKDFNSRPELRFSLGDAKTALTCLSNFCSRKCLNILIFPYVSPPKGSCSVCSPVLESPDVNLPKKKKKSRTMIVIWPQCWRVVGWDWPQLQTALSYMSLNCIGKQKERSVSKGIKEKFLWVESPLSLGYII